MKREYTKFGEELKVLRTRKYKDKDINVRTIDKKDANIFHFRKNENYMSVE